MERIVCLDTETTGLDKSKDHLIEIGCIEIINNVKTGNVFHTYINPPCKIERGAYEVHGLDNDFLSQYSPFAKVARNLLDFIEGAKLVIHNALFDLHFLNKELSSAGFKMINYNNVIDTLILARKYYPGSPASLDALCVKFEINNKMRKKHSALMDAELLAAVYMAMVTDNTKQVAMTFDNGTNIQNNPHSNILHVFERDKKFTLSEEEKKLHQELCDRIQNSVWDKISKL